MLSFASSNWATELSQTRVDKADYLNGKKILHLVNHDAMAVRFLLPLFRWQVSEGAEVHVACADWGRGGILRAAGLHVFSVPFSLNPWTALRAFHAVRSVIISEKFDLIHTHTTVAGWIGRFALVSLNRECDFHMLHGSFFDPALSYWKRAVFTWIEKFLSRYTSTYIVLNSFDKDVIVRKRFALPEDVHITLGEGIDNARIEQIASGVTPRPAVGRNFTVGFLGRIIRKKGVFDLIEAIHILDMKHAKKISAVLAGEFMSEQFSAKIHSLVSKLELADRITFLGPTEDLSSFFNAIDVLILPSHGEGEGFGMVIAEAAVAGRPVIVTDVPSFRDLVQNGKTGLVVARKEPKELAEAILRIAEGEELRDELARNLHERSNLYSETEVIGRLQEAYRSQVELRRGN